MDDDNDDDSNDKVGRNDDDNDKSNHNDAMTAIAIPTKRNATGDAMMAMSTMGNATSATGTIISSAAPTARCVQFHDQPVRQLACKLKALAIGQAKSSDSESEEPEESVDLAFDHEAKLLCFTMGISLDLGLPKTLKEALARRDMDMWKEAIANKIMNFIKPNAWKKVPMSQVLREK